MQSTLTVVSKKEPNKPADPVPQQVELVETSSRNFFEHSLHSKESNKKWCMISSSDKGDRNKPKYSEFRHASMNFA